MVAGALLYLYILTELVACMTVLEGSLPQAKEHWGWGRPRKTAETRLGLSGKGLYTQEWILPSGTQEMFVSPVRVC